MVDIVVICVIFIFFHILFSVYMLNRDPIMYVKILYEWPNTLALSFVYYI